MRLLFLSRRSLKKEKERKQTILEACILSPPELNPLYSLISVSFLWSSTEQSGSTRPSTRPSIHLIRPNPIISFQPLPHFQKLFAQSPSPKMNTPLPIMDLRPYINIPKPTFQPHQQNSNTDIEQQAAGLSAPNSNPKPDSTSRNDGISRGQNSVRTRVFSGLLLLSVIAIVAIVLVTTSGHHVKAGRVHG